MAQKTRFQSRLNPLRLCVRVRELGLSLKVIGLQRLLFYITTRELAPSNWANRNICTLSEILNFFFRGGRRVFCLGDDAWLLSHNHLSLLSQETFNLSESSSFSQRLHDIGTFRPFLSTTRQIQPQLWGNLSYVIRWLILLKLRCMKTREPVGDKMKDLPDFLLIWAESWIDLASGSIPLGSDKKLSLLFDVSLLNTTLLPLCMRIATRREMRNSKFRPRITWELFVSGGNFVGLPLLACLLACFPSAYSWRLRNVQPNVILKHNCTFLSWKKIFCSVQMGERNRLDQLGANEEVSWDKDSIHVENRSLSEDNCQTIAHYSKPGSTTTTQNEKLYPKSMIFSTHQKDAWFKATGWTRSAGNWGGFDDTQSGWGVRWHLRLWIWPGLFWKSHWFISS